MFSCNEYLISSHYSTAALLYGAATDSYMQQNYTSVFALSSTSYAQMSLRSDRRGFRVADSRLTHAINSIIEKKSRV